MRQIGAVDGPMAQGAMADLGGCAVPGPVGRDETGAEITGCVIAGQHIQPTDRGAMAVNHGQSVRVTALAVGEAAAIAQPDFQPGILESALQRTSWPRFNVPSAAP